MCVFLMFFLENKVFEVVFLYFREILNVLRLFRVIWLFWVRCLDRWLKIFFSIVFIMLCGKKWRCFVIFFMSFLCEIVLLGIYFVYVFLGIVLLDVFFIEKMWYFIIMMDCFYLWKLGFFFWWYLSWLCFYWFFWFLGWWFGLCGLLWDWKWCGNEDFGSFFLVWI